MYVNYCHECSRALSSAEADRCPRCAWLRCDCGACGCSYEMLRARPVLTTVPPFLGALAPRHVASARGGASRVGALAPAIVFATVAVLLAVGLSAALSFVAPEVAEAPAIAAVPPPEGFAPSDPESAAATPASEPSGGATAPAAAESTPPASSAAPAAAAVAPAAPAVPAAASSASASAPANAPPAAANTAPAAVNAPAAPAAASAAVPAAPNAAAPAASLPSVLYVANTDGQGAYLRTQPRDGNDTRMTAWNEGTAMTPLDTTTVQEANGPAVWVRVRDPRGNAGWVRQTYLRPTR